MPLRNGSYRRKGNASTRWLSDNQETLEQISVQVNAYHTVLHSSDSCETAGCGRTGPLFHVPLGVSLFLLHRAYNER